MCPCVRNCVSVNAYVWRGGCVCRTRKFEYHKNTFILTTKRVNLYNIYVLWYFPACVCWNLMGFFKSHSIINTIQIFALRFKFIWIISTFYFILIIFTIANNHQNALKEIIIVINCYFPMELCQGPIPVTNNY